MKTYVCGDIHGQAEAFAQVLVQSGFDLVNDQLIVLGDIVDGGANTFEVLELLLTIENLILIKGNHDNWAIRHIRGGIQYDPDSYSEFQTWYQQGGKATIDSYKKHGFDMASIPITHQTIFNRMVPYYIDDKNRLFVHGGFDPRVPIENQLPNFLMCDRDLITLSKLNTPTPYKNVFIGHTSTGAGWDGKLTLMEVDTLKYWQSDLVKHGR